MLKWYVFGNNNALNNVFLVTLRLLLLEGTNFSVLVVCCIWQVFILAF